MLFRSKDALNFFPEFQWIAGFADNSLCAGRQQILDFIRIGSGGMKYDGNAAGFSLVAELAEYRQSIQIMHDDIHQDRIRMILSRTLEGIHTAVGEEDFETAGILKSH